MTLVRWERPFGGSSDIPKVIADFLCFSQSAIRSRLGWTENTNFLEQFRYTIVASQLLNEHSNLGTYHRLKSPAEAGRDIIGSLNVNFSLLGVSLTGVVAFVVAWVLHRLRSVDVRQWDSRRVVLLSLVLIASTAGFYFYVLQQCLNFVRGQAIKKASSLVTSAQRFNAAASSAVAMIQEVELASRGYRMYVYHSVRFLSSN